MKKKKRKSAKKGNTRSTRTAGPARPGSRRSFGTLADALDPDNRARLHDLRAQLEQRAALAILDQRRRQPPPWRSTRAPGSTADGPATARTRRVPGVRGPVAPPPAAPGSRASLGLWGPTSTPRPRPPTRAGRPFAFWTLPPDLALVEAPRGTVAEGDRIDFRRTLQASTSYVASGGVPLFITVGFDFGTSSTKVVVGLPFEAGAPSVAIPSPRFCRVEGHPYLWRTALWLDGGMFMPYPTDSAIFFGDLKRGMMEGGGGGGDTSNNRSGATSSVDKSEAAAAYVAYVLQHTRGWVARNRPELLKGRDPVWFVNIGLPASTYDNPPLFCGYRRMAAAALMLVNAQQSVERETVRAFLRNPDVWKAGDSSEEADRLGVAVTPEVAAGATSFAKSYRGATGLYLMVDVGAATLDACVFRLNIDPSGPDHYPLLAADVRPLGVEAVRWFRGRGREVEQCAEQCERCLREVIWSTKVRRDPQASCWKSGGDLPIFVIGGGARSDLHQAVVRAVGPWLEDNTGSEGVRVLGVENPAVDLPERTTDYGRLAVAWGLSHPPTEMGQIEPMSRIDDVPAARGRDWRSFLVSKDQV